MTKFGIVSGFKVVLLSSSLSTLSNKEVWFFTTKKLRKAFAFLECFATSIDSWLPTFRNSLLVPSSSTALPLQMEPMGF